MPTSGSRLPRPRAGSDAPTPRLRLTVQRAVATAGLPVRSTLRRWLLRALRRDATVTVRFVGAAEGRRLNREFRGKDYATNVLTFVYDAAAAPAAARGAAPLTGDIALCVPVLRREARAARKTLRAHCAHLVIHGALHLQGFDHQSAKDARVMEALETRLLAALGYGDPYATN
ncbi:MAG: rRNA maturation RNase YbeY [Betaproteobacteria bacterium]|nr:rRNA maturation RNase YbeY [Betaproteobacteria bacterium]